ncbi:MAG: universal stress protein [Candidatus Binataceae bacterium]
MSTTQKMKVLCPIDFDVNSLVALDLARDLVRENDGTLFLLHVVATPDPFVISAPLMVKRAEDFARIQLEEIARDSLGDVNHHVILRTGRPTEQIIEVAAEVRAHMVVMATHGRSGVSRFFLGSVAEKVVREASCPVLTIRGTSVSEPAHSDAAAVTRGPS